MPQPIVQPQSLQHPHRPPEPATCEPFSYPRFDRQVTLDRAGRWGFIALIALAVVLSEGLDATSGFVAIIPIMTLLGIWLWFSQSNARAAQALAHATALLDSDPAQSESIIAGIINRFPMQRAIRLLLYHRLATIRHRQQRFAEAAAIAQSLLAHRLGMADAGPRTGSPVPPGSASRASVGPVRAHLLLMLTECHLHMNNLWGAHQSLMELSKSKLGMIESLQRLALQTRYEVTAGHFTWALNDLENKVRQAELMPHTHAAAMHALLATAAEKAGRGETALWLRQRAQLLSTPEQLQEMGLK